MCLMGKWPRVVLLGITAILLAYCPSSLAQRDGQIFSNAPAAQPAQTHVQTGVQNASPPHARRLEQLMQSQKQAIVDKHNALRSAVTSPCTAADMETLVWDEALAKASETYAAKCTWQHDPLNRERGWGENLAMRWSSAANTYDANLLTGFVQAWYDEIVDTDWSADHSSLVSKTYANPSTKCQSYDSARGNCMIGHYTQVVWAKTNKVGCAVVACDKGLLGQGGVMLVCKYTPAGNLGSSAGGLVAPYVLGAPCGACSSKCSSGTLCDIGSTPNRCQDDITTMVFNGVPHKDCTSLRSFTNKFGPNYWCSKMEQKHKICQLTCNACSVPAGIGMSSCGKAGIHTNRTGITSTSTTGATSTSTTSTTILMIKLAGSFTFMLPLQAANQSLLRDAATLSMEILLRLPRGTVQLTIAPARRLQQDAQSLSRSLRRLSTAWDATYTLQVPSSEASLVQSLVRASSQNTTSFSATLQKELVAAGADAAIVSSELVVVQFAEANIVTDSEASSAQVEPEQSKTLFRPALIGAVLGASAGLLVVMICICCVCSRGKQRIESTTRV